MVYISTWQLPCSLSLGLHQKQQQQQHREATLRKPSQEREVSPGLARKIGPRLGGGGWGVARWQKLSMAADFPMRYRLINLNKLRDGLPSALVKASFAESAEFTSTCYWYARHLLAFFKDQDGGRPTERTSMGPGCKLECITFCINELTWRLLGLGL